MTGEEFSSAIEKLEGESFILRYNKPLRDIERKQLRDAWRSFNERLGTHKALIIMPDTTHLESLPEHFNFSIALILVDAGYKVARDTWEQGNSIYKNDGVIRQSHDGKEWTPTQGALRATNWKLA